MSKTHRPRRGSLAYSPRKRVKSETPRVRAWPKQAEPGLLGFAGYKAGMTHVMMTDNTPHSLTSEMVISVPVTILETPPLKVAAIRVYDDSPYGANSIAEAWTDDLDRELDRTLTLPKKHDLQGALSKIEQLINDGVARDLKVITYTLPEKVPGIPRKKPELMENKIGGSNLVEQFEYARTVLGKTVEIGDVFKDGDIVDVIAVTTGKGTQGPVKRWGIQLGKGKHSRQGSKRQVGNLGPWKPHHVSWRVPQLGQTGYHQRTEFNKKVMQIGENGESVTPAGGFLNYGIVRNNYIIIKGSVPGPVKRLVRIRPAIRPKEQRVSVPEISYLSLQSKQG